MADIYSKDYIIELLRKVGLHEYKILHSIGVANLALKIAKEVEKTGHMIDIKTVQAGALLHDIGISKTIDDASPSHAAIGGELARKYDYSEEVARCIEDHEVVFATKEEGKQTGMQMSRDSFVPQTWEEKVVAYADLALFIVSECQRKKDFWEDPHCAEKAFFPYLKEIFRKYSGVEVDSKHPFLQREYAFHQEMKQYIKPEFFEDEEYKKIVEQMHEAQRAYGLKLPFPYAEKLD
jgi:uncharacterized protein